MAATVESTSIKAYASGSTIAIDKPTGLAVGDLIVALIHKDGGTNSTCSSSGWNTIDAWDDDALTGDFGFSLYKVATSGDVAASNFTFTLGETVVTGGAILRISGYETTNIINGHVFAANTNGSGTSMIYPVGFTPTQTSMFILANFNAGNVTTTSQAIVTSNPSWTEVVDQGNAAPCSMAVAWANRPQATATSNATCTLSGTDTGFATLIAITDAYTAITDTLTITDTSFGNMTSKTIETLSITDSQDADRARVWINQDKSVTTWDNQEK